MSMGEAREILAKTPRESFSKPISMLGAPDIDMVSHHMSSEFP